MASHEQVHHIEGTMIGECSSKLMHKLVQISKEKIDDLCQKTQEWKERAEVAQGGGRTVKERCIQLQCKQR